jgi:hypothetical protein
MSLLSPIVLNTGKYNVRNVELELRMVDGALERLRLQESKMKRITQSEMTERMKELAERENMCSRRPRSQLQDIYGDYVRRHNANVDILTERISGYVVHRLYLLKKLDELKKQQ